MPAHVIVWDLETVPDLAGYAAYQRTTKVTAANALALDSNCWRQVPERE